MFWEDEAAEHKFYTRILKSQPFQLLLNNYFDSNMIERHAKSLTLRAVKEITNPYFDDQLRDACFQAIGKTCCHMFLEFGEINTKTDIDTFIKNINTASQGYRRYKRRNNLVYEELYVGKCWCPIINNIEIKKDCKAWCDCSKSARGELFQTILKKPVEVQLLGSIICNDSNVCQWVINLEPKKTARRK